MSVRLFGIKDDGRQDLIGLAPGWEILMRLAPALNEHLKPYSRAIAEDLSLRGKLPDGMPIWTVYDHPSDWPGWYVARLFFNETRTGELLLDRHLKRLRDALTDRGLVPIMRAESDDPIILETWL